MYGNNYYYTCKSSVLILFRVLSAPMGRDLSILGIWSSHELVNMIIGSTRDQTEFQNNNRVKVSELLFFVKSLIIWRFIQLRVSG